MVGGGWCGSLVHWFISSLVVWWKWLAGGDTLFYVCFSAVARSNAAGGLCHFLS